MIEQVIILCLMAVASGTVALMLTASHMTRPLRHEWIDAPYMLGELINCPYCMGFWTGLLTSALISTNVPSFIGNWLIITGLSHLFMGVVQRLFLFRESENEELREMLRESREVINELAEAKKDGPA